MKIRPGKVVSIKRSIFYSLVLIITISIILNGIVWLISEKSNLQQRIVELKEREMNTQKTLLKQEVEKTIADIQFQIYYRKGMEVDSIRNEVLEWVSKKRLVYGGYLFINKLDGQALVFDGKRVNEYKNVTDMTDPKGLRLFDIEKEAYSSPEGKYMEYFFKPMDSDIPEEKLSYVKGFPYWEWIIGAGIYKKIPTLQIEKQKANYLKSFNNKILFISIITLFLICISYFIVRRIGYRLSWQVDLLKDSLRKVSKTDELIKLENIKYGEFRQIGSSVNQMITEKRELEKTVREKDESLKLVFKAAEYIAFIITDLGGKNSVIKEFSPGAEKIFGYKKEEIIDKDIDLLYQPVSFSRFDIIQNLLKEGLKGFSGEITLVKKDKQVFPAFYTIHPLFKNNQVAGSIVVIIDISKSKKTEEELRKLKMNLEQIVEDRTKEIIVINEALLEKNKELENYNNLFIGREFRINELKQKIKELESKLETKTGTAAN